MKNRFLILCLLCSITLFGQISDRQMLKGKINVPSNADASNINIYNINSEKGTTTNSIGEFLISVKEDDHIMVTSVQFQKFEVVIDKKIMNELDIVITIRESVYQLNEVVVRSNLLSGDLNVDVGKIKVANTNMKIEEKEVLNSYNANFTTGTQIRAQNVAIQEEYLQNGMNFVEIFKRYIKKPKRETKHHVEQIDVEVRKMYDNSFFKEYMNVDEDEINAFIFYAETHGLDQKMLKSGNEMELIQFLIETSEHFRIEDDKN